MSFSVSYIYKVIDNYSVPLARIARKTKSFERQMVRTNASLRMFEATTKSTKKSVAKYTSGLTQASAKKFAYGQTIDATNRKIAQSADKFKRTAREIDATTRKAAKYENRMKSVGRSLKTWLLLPMTAIGIASLKMSMDMNAGMANVATLIPKAAGRVRELKKEIQSMSVATGISTKVMSDGLYQVISAFGDTADTTKILEINAKAAKAGMATVADAVNLTSAVMKSYGVVNEQGAQKASDLAFQTVKLGQTSFPELASSIGRVIPLAATLGMTQEELFASYATLTGVTGNAAEVSTQMAGALRAMLKPTENMKKLYVHLKKTGEISKATGKALVSEKGLIPAMKLMFKLTGGNEEMLTSMFGRMEPLVALFSLTGAQADTFTRKMSSMFHVLGVGEEAFEVQARGINKAGFAWAQFKTKMVVNAQKIGDKLIPTFMRIMEAAQETSLSIEGIAAAIKTMLKPLEWLIKLANWSVKMGEKHEKFKARNIERYQRSQTSLGSQFQIEQEHLWGKSSVMEGMEGAKGLPPVSNPMVGKSQAMNATLNGQINVSADNGAKVTAAEMSTDFAGSLGFNMGN